MIADLQRMDEAMGRKYLGLGPQLFRPPYGVTNPNVKKAILGGYTPIGWSVRSMDTVTKEWPEIVSEDQQTHWAGAVPVSRYLFLTLEALPAFIEVKNRGYEKLYPLDRLLHLRPYA